MRESVRAQKVKKNCHHKKYTGDFNHFPDILKKNNFYSHFLAQNIDQITMHWISDQSLVSTSSTQSATIRRNTTDSRQMPVVQVPTVHQLRAENTVRVASLSL